MVALLASAPVAGRGISRRQRDIMRGFLAVLAAAAVLAACGDDGTAPAETTITTAPPATIEPTPIEPTTTTAPPTTTAEETPDPVLAEGDEYVALGSSIASGFGISVQSTPCGRSDRNYPNLVAAEFELDLIDVSCGASRIPNVVDTAQGEFPPQIEALSLGTRLVTFTIGGNDIGLNATALGCGNPETVCAEPAELEANIASLRPQLVDMIDTVRALSPEATIVLVTVSAGVPGG